jgi:hypothetical protein
VYILFDTLYALQSYVNRTGSRKARVFHVLLISLILIQSPDDDPTVGSKLVALCNNKNHILLCLTDFLYLNISIFLFPPLKFSIQKILLLGRKIVVGHIPHPCAPSPQVTPMIGHVYLKYVTRYVTARFGWQVPVFHLKGISSQDKVTYLVPCRRHLEFAVRHIDNTEWSNVAVQLMITIQKVSCLTTWLNLLGSRPPGPAGH